MPSSTTSEASLIKKLRETRPHFEEEGILHDFLRDAHSGGGGFRNGQVPMPAVTYWGRRSYERGNSNWYNSYRYQRGEFNARPSTQSKGQPARQTWSYITAFPGEDCFAYADRVSTATYVNPIEPIVRVTNSFLMESDADRDDLGDTLSDWITKVNPERQHIREVAKNVTFRCQLVGWCATVVDLPRTEPAANFAESMAAGQLPYLTVFWPQEVLDWDLDARGELVSIKLVTYHELPRADMLAPKRYSEHITIWYADRWERYVIEISGPEGRTVRPQILERDSGPNPFGRVPVVFCRWDEPLAGPAFTGQGQIQTLAHIARKAFNQQSELDYQMRQQVFGQLVGPMRRDGVTKGVESLGPGNFLEEPWEAKGVWRYIAPSGECAQTYEKALERGKRDVYRIALIDPGEGRQAETAESRRLRFQQTEAMLATMAGNLDKWEMGIYRLIGPQVRVSEAELARVAVRRKRTYAIQAVMEQLDSAIKALELPIGPKARTAIVQRALRSMLPDSAEKDLVDIDTETEKLIETLEKQKQESRKLLAQAAAGGADAGNTAPSSAQQPPPAADQGQQPQQPAGAAPGKTRPKKTRGQAQQQDEGANT